LGDKERQRVAVALWRDGDGVTLSDGGERRDRRPPNRMLPTVRAKLGKDAGNHRGRIVALWDCQPVRHALRQCSDPDAAFDRLMRCCVSPETVLRMDGVRVDSPLFRIFIAFLSAFAYTIPSIRKLCR
jgi:hypothetical protein